MTVIYMPRDTSGVIHSKGQLSRALNYIVNPEINQKVESEGRVIVLGNDQQISELNKVFKLLKS